MMIPCVVVSVWLCLDIDRYEDDDSLFSNTSLVASKYDLLQEKSDCKIKNWIYAR